MKDLIIIGAGPGGLSASVYAKRAGLDALTLEAQPISGGQVLNTYSVDNYLGFSGIGGFELGNKFREHADDLGCPIEEAEVKDIRKTENGFEVISRKETYEAKAVVLALGAEHSKLHIPGEEELAGMGVSYCATCDGAFFKGRSVAVVGGGDVAVEDAIYLARTCSKVYLIHRRGELRAARMLQEQLLGLQNVEVLWDTVVDEILGEDQVEALSITNIKDKISSKLPVDGIFIAVGMNPQNDLLKCLGVDMDEKGFAKADDDCVTSVPGIFAVGDIRTKRVRQIVTAVSDGANGIYSVETYLRNLTV